MDNVFMILIIISIVGICSPALLSKAIKRKFKRRYYVIATIVFFIGFGISSPKADQSASAPVASAKVTATPAPSLTPEEQQKKKDEADAKAKADADAKAKADADAKIKADADAKAKADADAKAKADAAKTIAGNGTFAVNDEIKPGIYKSSGDINYWARLAGFSGNMKDILANGNPSGSDVVEIKATDKGFQTSGSGKWRLVDDSYTPAKLTEFGDGTYLVGKDIDSGTYKSDGSVTYWVRLSNFSGDMKAILANGNPGGPEIVEIASTDKGFQTTGGGKWKKIK